MNYDNLRPSFVVELNHFFFKVIVVIHEITMQMDRSKCWFPEEVSITCMRSLFHLSEADTYRWWTMSIDN